MQNEDSIIKLADDIIAVNPERVLLNPVTESPELQRKLEVAGIHVENASTLVLLRKGQF